MPAPPRYRRWRTIMCRASSALRQIPSHSSSWPPTAVVVVSAFGAGLLCSAHEFTRRWPRRGVGLPRPAARPEGFSKAILRCCRRVLGRQRRAAPVVAARRSIRALAGRDSASILRIAVSSAACSLTASLAPRRKPRPRNCSATIVRARAYKSSRACAVFCGKLATARRQGRIVISHCRPPHAYNF